MRKSCLLLLLRSVLLAENGQRDCDSTCQACRRSVHGTRSVASAVSGVHARLRVALGTTCTEPG